MKISIEYRIVSISKTWNKLWLANWEKKGQPRLREDGSPCQPGDPTGTIYQEFRAVAKDEAGNIVLRKNSPPHMRQHALAELESAARGNYPNCEVEIKEVA